MILDGTTIVVAVIGGICSSGVMSFLQFLINRQDKKKDLLIGLAHDRLYYLATKYIEKGWLTKEEYTNIYEYIYVPYHENGGNGTGTRLMEEVMKLPIREGDN